MSRRRKVALPDLPFCPNERCKVGVELRFVKCGPGYRRDVSDVFGERLQGDMSRPLSLAVRERVEDDSNITEHHGLHNVLLSSLRLPNSGQIHGRLGSVGKVEVRSGFPTLPLQPYTNYATSSIHT